MSRFEDRIKAPRMAFGAPFPFGGKPPLAASYNGATIGGQNVMSFSGVSFGTAAAGRVIVIAFYEATFAGAISACTIGGISASLVIRANGGVLRSSLWAAVVPTGTSGTVAVTFTVNGNVSFHCYSIYGAASATAVASNSAITGTSLSVNLSGLPAGALAIGSAVCGSNAAVSWTGLTLDHTDAVAANELSGAHAQVLGGGSLSITVTLPTSTNSSAVSAAWGP